MVARKSRKQTQSGTRTAVVASAESTNPSDHRQDSPCLVQSHPVREDTSGNQFYTTDLQTGEALKDPPILETPCEVQSFAEGLSDTQQLAEDLTKGLSMQHGPLDLLVLEPSSANQQIAAGPLEDKMLMSLQQKKPVQI